MVCATCKGSDQPAHTRSLIRAFACRLNVFISVKLQTDHHLMFVILTGGCRGLSESTNVKMPHCWKSRAAAQLFLLFIFQGIPMITTVQQLTVGNGMITIALMKINLFVNV